MYPLRPDIKECPEYLQTTVLGENPLRKRTKTKTQPKPQYLEKNLSEKEQKPRLNPHKTSHTLQDSKTGRVGKRKILSTILLSCRHTPTPAPYLIFFIRKLRKRHFRATHITKSTLLAFLSSGFA